MSPLYKMFLDAGMVDLAAVVKMQLHTTHAATGAAEDVYDDDVLYAALPPPLPAKLLKMLRQGEKTGVTS